MDRICCLAYLLHQSNDEKIKNIAVQLLNGDISLKEVKNIKELKPRITATETKLKQVDTHKVAQFVEKFMVMV